MAFFLATPTTDALEEIAPDIDLSEHTDISVLTVKDGSMSKKDFFESLSVEETNKFKAMAFDILVKEMKESDDEYVCYLQGLVSDAILDDEPFFWPRRFQNSIESDKSSQPKTKKAKH